MNDYNFYKKELDQYLEKKNYELAKKRCEEFIAKDANGFLYNYLGYIYFLQSDFKQSIQQYHKALSYKENEFIIFQNIGECYLNLKDFSAAKHFFIKSLTKNIINLSIIKKIYYLSNYDLDYKDFYRLLSSKQLIKNIRKNHIKFLYELIGFLSYENETSILCQLAKSNFSNNFISEDESLYLKAYIYFNLNLFELAKDYFLKIKKGPLVQQSYIYLFDIYGMEGKTYLAYKYFLKLYRNNIVTPHMLRTISMFYKFKSESDNLFLKINSFQKKKINQLDSDGQANIYFALAKSFEDMKKYKNSFQFLEKANQEKNKCISFNLEKVQSEINFYKHNFTLEFYEKFKNKGYKNISPIFIVGLPRSGSTLLEQIISNTKKVDPLSETKAFRNTLKYFFNIYDPNIFINQLKNLNADDVFNIGKKYHDSIKHLTNKDSFTDKMLFNFNYLILIKVALPNSKIIITQRNYKDLFLSIYKNYFSDDNLNFAYNKNNILNFIKIYDDMINYSANILKDDLIFFEYDKFVSNQDLFIEKIFNFCNLKWNNQFLLSDNKNYISTASRSQARKNIYSTSLKSYEFYSDFLKEYFSELDKI